MSRRISVKLLTTAALVGMTAITSISGLPPSSASASSKSSTITVAYGSNYVFDSAALTTKWWNQVRAQYEAKYPNVKVNFIPIPGNYADIVNKLALLYKSPSTAPDVAELPSEEVGLYGQSGYLLKLNKYLGSTTWWSEFPKSVQDDGTYSGTTYAVNHGENTVALMYNKAIFRRAGIAVPWQPKTWQDILNAAEKIKETTHGVTPLWLDAGTSAGANGPLEGINNFIDGTTTPTIEAKNGKWVVDSPGIRAALTFYKEAFSAGVTPPISELFSAAPVQLPQQLFASGKLAIGVSGNWFGGSWTKIVSAPYWASASKTMGVAILPTDYNPNKPASTLGGWDLAVSKTTSNAQAAFNFINTAESNTNSIDAANWGGWVPPQKTLATSPAYSNFAPPFNQFFASVLSDSMLTPSSLDYSVWVEGIGQATGQIAQNPKTTVSQAIATLKNYVVNNLGASAVETIK